MTKYNNYWRWIPVKMIQNYPNIKSDNSIQAQLFASAIEAAMEETRLLPDGLLRLRSVGLVYIAKTHSIDGAAMDIGASRRTIQRWLNAFVYLVAERAGYIDKN